MLSTAEREKYYQEIWDPHLCSETFTYLLSRWGEDYSSVRSGIMALREAVMDQFDIDIPYYTLLRYTEKKSRVPHLTLAIPVLRVILQK